MNRRYLYFIDEIAKDHDRIFGDEVRPHEVEILKRCKNTRPKRVADVGCGTGRLFKHLSGMDLKITGIEASENMAEQAKKRATEFRGCKVICSDFLTWKTDEEFDMVLLLGNVLGSLKSKDFADKIIKKAKEHLGVGGVIIFDFSNSDNPKIAASTIKKSLSGQGEKIQGYEIVLEDVRFSFPNISYRPNELRHILELCGFTKIECFGVKDPYGKSMLINGFWKRFSNPYIMKAEKSQVF